MGKTPGNCDDATCDFNRTKAKQTVGDRMYGQVQVTVKSSDAAGNIELLLPRNDGQVQLLTTKWGDLNTMWAPCPSSLVSSAEPGNPGPPPPAESTGGLYISDLVLLTPTGEDKDVQHDAIKWPRQFNDDTYAPYQTVKVWPTKIVVTGIAPDSGITTVASIDLLDPRMAKQNQEIMTDHGMLTLALTRNGCQNLGIVFDNRRHLTRAIEIIKTEKANPDALAAAWRIVADAVEQHDTSSDDDSYRSRLREVLPAYKL